jgi:hypothetical protein
MRVKISVLVPAREAPEHLANYPKALRESDCEPLVIVTAGGSSSGVEISL